MENPDASKYELLLVIACFGIAFTLTYITKKQRDSIRKQKEERKQMTRDLVEIKNRLK